MKKSLRPIALVLMRKLIGRCVGSRIDWRKLFLVATIMTTAGVVVPTFVFPYPLHTWLLSPTVPSLNSTMQLGETYAEPRGRQSPLSPPFLIVSVNSSAELIKLQQGKKKKPIVSLGRNPLPRKRRKKSKVNDEPKVILPPPRETVPYRLQRHIWSLPPDEALLYARKEIELASEVKDDPYLYPPIFRNISLFKRSYELMELILKVYIYPDGARPIFHQPHLTGIYASEGWFLRLMEGNRQFVTRDPEKAQLFYLPYSTRQLEHALYVPDSHNLRPLSIFLRDYVNMLAMKYPFWNRTHGRDHFLVACHDWGPYTVTAHEELAKNTIKALCNADLSEGIFVAGRDVSLPETTIRTYRRPLRYIGNGNRVSQRPILAFFAGNMHGRVRPILLKHWLDKDEDMRIYGPLPSRVSRKMNYVQHMKSSKYCICPMGFEVNSPRIVEAIYYECVPVIIADNFALPFSEVLDWSAFSVVVAEKDIPKLKEILLAIPLRRYLTMQINVKMVQKHFLWNPRPIRFDLFHMILHSIWFSRVNHIPIPQS
ncbi:exostosin family protein [Tripterygium wilfordii]|uniref:Exostosin family protein n=1 Tax=Tripterygium wilfordii TaxID=458696 RepID=A0A7J7C6T4_TRIWF|nr:probable glycosyltransferase At5g25310 [Tripterygium wilfordii]KAF5729831.1 exostosin family protein [Tripterygium wilfordii]